MDEVHLLKWQMLPAAVSLFLLSICNTATSTTTVTSTSSVVTSSTSTIVQPTVLPGSGSGSGSGLSTDVLEFLTFSRPSRLRRYLDGVSDRIYIANGLPVGLQTHTVAYVGTNGVISFSRPFYYWYPSPFPGYYYLRRFYVVAPYWADHDIRSEGEVLYETFERGRSQNDDNMLRRVNDYLRFSKTTTNFYGTFMILAEWRNVHPYPHGSRYLYYFLRYYPSLATFINQENTYQALVITDGSESYTVFTYMCDSVQWSGLWRYPTIGYNAAGTLFANHPLTAQKEANQIDNCESDSQYINVVYKISADGDIIERLRKECLAWYYSDIESYKSNYGDDDISAFSSNQNACPCTSRQAWWDRRFWYFTSKDDSFCFIERFPNSRGGAQECCYSRANSFFNGALIDQGRSSGALLRYHPYWSWRTNYFNYITYDRNPQEICCLSAVGYCKFYHERRPPRSCVGYVPQRRTWGWGDPHITTTDGRRYTFNGLGEYVLITTSNFEFQGRTELASNSNATVFSAFALREGGDVVEVRMNNGSFIVKLNVTDVSESLNEVGDNVTATTTTSSTSSTFIERSSNNSITVSFPSGVGITINYTAGLLVYTLEVPSSFEGTTSGLLGNYNNDDSDEFVFRDGTMTSNSSSDQEIHQFGQSWQITQEESIFTYDPGESVNTFSDPNHVPPFLDEILSSLIGNSTLTDVCGDNAECLFDFDQTGDVEVGMAAMAVENETALEMQESFSFPPNITAPEIFMATVGEESVYTFTVSSDSQNISVIILHEGEETLPSGVQLTNPDGDSYTITWTPADNTSVLNLTIVAMDLNFDISSIFNPVVQLCACENEGNCTTNGLLVTDSSFVVLNCQCPEGYDGEFCQNDADGCDIISCLDGQQCFDYPAPLVGAECACPDGYTASNDSKCIDIDECANSSTNDCTQQCINTPGSYECDCYDGYRAITPNATQCEDINECEGYNDCHQICTNTNGSYYCSCYTGFMLNMTNNRTCEADIPCATNNCSQGCANISGTEDCFCFSGYQLNNDNITCSDIDECTENPCEQECTNNNGSFTCSCNNGYELDDNGRSCNDIDECLSGPCPPNLICNNMDGNYSCDCPDGTMKNGTDCVLILITVTPTRLFTTPPQPSITPSQSSGMPVPTVSPTTGETSDDELSVGAIVGITLGGLVVGFVAVMILAFVVNKWMCTKKGTFKIAPDHPEDHNLMDSKEDPPLEIVSTGEEP